LDSSYLYVAGFLGGVAVTFFLYMILIYQIEVHPSVALVVCAVIGLVLTMAMAFSQNLRCLVLLMLPQFFTSMTLV